MRHGRPSSAKTCNGVQEPFAGEVESTVPREVGGRPAQEPEHEAGDLRAEAREKRPGLG